MLRGLNEMNENIMCRKCGSKETLELHHLIPKCMDGTDADGRRRLCKKHHDILGHLILKWVWDFIPNDRRELCKKYVKEKSLDYIYGD